MSGFPGGHAALLATALTTHALVGYTLGRIAVDRPVAGLAGGLLADVDLLVPRSMGWPLAHRGITHTALAGVVVVGLAYAVWRRGDLAVAVGLGYGSQLAIDLTTAQGVALLYPLSNRAITVLGGGHSPGATAALCSGCLVTLWLDRRWRERPGARGSTRTRPWQYVRNRLR